MAARKLRWRKDGRVNIPIEEAMWQYLVDHSSYTKNNTFLIRIEVKSFEKFISSLSVRVKGKYRYSEEDVRLTRLTPQPCQLSEEEK